MNYIVISPYYPHNFQKFSIELKNQGIDKLNEFIKPIEYVISSFTDKLLHSFFDKMVGE